MVQATGKQRRSIKRLMFWGGFLGLLVIIWGLLSQPVFFVKKDGTTPPVSAVRLESNVRMLSEALAPRDSAHPQNLEKVASFLADEFRMAGGRVETQGYTANKKDYENVIARFGPETGPRIVLGAHYDSFEALPAADDNASGVAGLIELAYLLGKQPPSKTVELVAYTLEEPPYFSSDFMGSAVHAKSLKQQGADVEYMVSLEMIGYFSDSKGSQEPTSPIYRVLIPGRGNFIAIVGRFWDMGLVRKVKSGMLGGSDLPVISLNAPSFVPGIDLSDHLNYWKEGFPAVMITDTAFLRNDNYHLKEDTAAKLDYKRMAMVVQDVFALIQTEK